MDSFEIKAITDGVKTKTQQITVNVTPVNDVPSGTVFVSGNPTLSQILTATNTLADADGLGAISYQWKADGATINGATSSTFILTQAQVGKAITVAASYTDIQGTAESKTSAATSAVTNFPGQTLNGTSANDSLTGGLGNDSINGGAGNDSLTGGAATTPSTAAAV